MNFTKMKICIIIAKKKFAGPVWVNNTAQCHENYIFLFEPKIWSNGIAMMHVWANNEIQCHENAISILELIICLSYAFIFVLANTMTICHGYATMMFESSIWHSVMAMLYTSLGQQYNTVLWLCYILVWANNMAQCYGLLQWCLSHQ